MMSVNQIGSRVGAVAALAILAAACSSGPGAEDADNASTTGSAAATTLCGPSPRPQLCKSYQCEGDGWVAIPVADGLSCQPAGTFPTPYACVSGTCLVKHTGTILPHYMVVMIMYAPPGNASTVKYGTGSTVGSSFTTDNSFKNDLTVGASSPLASISLDYGFSMDDKKVFKLTKQATSTETVASTSDGIDHDQDRFVLWINPQLELSQTGALVKWENIGNNGNGMTTVTVSAAQLKNPSTILAGDQPYFTQFVPEDYQAILALDPFAVGAAPDLGGRFVQTGQTLEYQPSVSTEFTSVTSKNTTVTHTWSNDFTLDVSVGPNLFSIQPLKIEDKMTLSYGSAQEDSSQFDQTADIQLKTTSNVAGVFDVYYDNLFKSFLFITAPAPCIDEPPATTCAGKQCGSVTNNCGHAVSCPNTCAAPSVCGGVGGGPNGCGCAAQPLSVTCAGKQCGSATNNCGQAVTCPNTCVAPASCGGAGAGQNSCGCLSTGNPCGNHCGGTATDNCGNVFTCHQSCGLDGQCPLAGGTCSATSHTCVCRTGPGL